jgi:DNA-binding NarL/FixJ family response regulator
MKKTRVVLVDDENMVREAMATLLQAAGNIEVVGQAANGEEGLRVIQQTRPDVVILDMRLNGKDNAGLEYIAPIRKKFPDTQVLVLTAFPSAETMYQAIQAGAIGFLPKSYNSRELVEGIRSLQDGAPVIPPDLAYHLIASGAFRSNANTLQLTEQEIEVLKLLGAGFSNAQIAKKMTISPNTARKHVQAVFKKIGVNSRLEAALYAWEKGILTAKEKQDLENWKNQHG